MSESNNPASETPEEESDNPTSEQSSSTESGGESAAAQSAADSPSTTESTRLTINRRNALTIGGLIAFLYGSATPASADAQGTVGTGGDPLTTLHTEEINGGVTDGQALTNVTGANLSIDGSGTLNVSGSNKWAESDGDELLELAGSETGIDVTDVQTESLNGGVTGDTDLTSLSGDGLAIDSGSLGIATGGVGSDELANDSLTVASNSVSLGGSTGVDYVDLVDTGSSFPIPNSDIANSSVTVTAGNGLTNGGSVSLGNSTTLDVDPTDIVGTGLTAESTDIGIAHQGVTSSELASGAVDSIHMSDGAVTSNKITTDAVTGTEIDLSDIAGQNITVDTNNDELDAASAAFTESDSDDLLEPVSPYTGIDVTAVQTDSLNGGVTGSTDLTSLTGTGLTISGGSLGISDSSVGTTQLNTPFADLSTLFGSPVTAGANIDLNGNNLTDSTGNLTLEASSGNELTFDTDGGSTTLKLGVPTSDGTDLAGGNVVAGYQNNQVENGAVGVVIGGGGSDYTNQQNKVTGNYATVGGGRGNTASELGAVAGGGGNIASGSKSTVGGGTENAASSQYATVGGGHMNGATATNATVSGGNDNTARGSGSTVGGGIGNTASGTNATVPGGKFGAAEDHDSFVWNDGTEYHSISIENDGLSSSTAVDGESVTGTNTFSASAQNGVRFITGSAASPSVVTLTDDGTNAELTFHSNLPDETGTAIGINTDGKLVKSPSSARYKTNIQPLSTDTSAVLNLEPKAFEYEDSGDESTGLIAEDVDELLPELVYYDDEGRPESVQYDRVGVYLVPEVDENRGRIDNLEAELDERDARIETQQERIDELEAENERLRDRLDAIESELGIGAAAEQQGVDDD